MEKALFLQPALLTRPEILDQDRLSGSAQAGRLAGSRTGCHTTHTLHILKVTLHSATLSVQLHTSQYSDGLTGEFCSAYLLFVNSHITLIKLLARGNQWFRSTYIIMRIRIQVRVNGVTHHFVRMSVSTKERVLLSEVATWVKRLLEIYKR